MVHRIAYAMQESGLWVCGLLCELCIIQEYFVIYFLNIWHSGSMHQYLWCLCTGPGDKGINRQHSTLTSQHDIEHDQDEMRTGLKISQSLQGFKHVSHIQRQISSDVRVSDGKCSATDMCEIDLNAPRQNQHQNADESSQRIANHFCVNCLQLRVTCSTSSFTHLFSCLYNNISLFFWI